MRRFIILAVAAAATLLPTIAQASPPVVDLVDSWYVHYLGRHGEPSGMNTHITELCEGLPATVVEAAFIGSTEYYQRHGSSPEGFVAAMFADVLGRSPTQAEFRFWMTRFERSGDRCATAVDFLRDYRPDNVAPTTAYHGRSHVVPATSYYRPAPSALHVRPAPGVALGLRFDR